MPRKQSKKPSTRTYPVDGDRLRALRLGKSWTVEQLANKADVSPATILLKEKGEDAYMATLKALASTLGAEPSYLIRGHVLPVDEPLHDATTASCRIIWEFNTTDEAKIIALLERLCDLIGGGEIIPLKISSGSVIVEFDTAKPDMLKLIDLFCRGDLPPEIDMFICESESDFLDQIMSVFGELNSPDKAMSTFVKYLIRGGFDPGGHLRQVIRTTSEKITFELDEDQSTNKLRMCIIDRETIASENFKRG